MKPLNEINLKLTVEETNLLLESLGQMPFVRVYTLIAKIQTQAGQQIQNDSNGITDEQPSVKAGS